MTESVQNNVNRPQLTFMDAVQRGANILMQMGTVCNNNRGCFGYGFMNFNPNYGMDPIDMMIRSPYLGGIAANWNNNFAPGTNINTTSTSTTNEKTKNSAEAFKNISWETIEQMKTKEAEIKAKEKEVAAEKDAENKNKLSKELQDLKNEYLKAEKELANGIQLSKEIGNNTSFTFYTNIDEKEFEQIGDFNTAIDTLKSEIANIEKESNDLKIEFENARKELMRQGRPCDDQSVLSFLPSDKKTKIENNKTLYDETVAKTEAKIKELNSCIAKAGKDNNTTYFYTHIAKAENEEKQKAPSKAGEKLAEGMFGSDGKIKSRDDLKAKIKESNPNIDDSDIDAILDSFYTEGMTEKQLKEKLQSKEFFKDALDKHIKDDNSETEKNRAKFLISFYDGFIGKGSFEKVNNLHAKQIIETSRTPSNSVSSTSGVSSQSQRINELSNDDKELLTKWRNREFTPDMERTKIGEALIRFNKIAENTEGFNERLYIAKIEDTFYIYSKDKNQKTENDRLLSDKNETRLYGSSLFNTDGVRLTNDFVDRLYEHINKQN